MRWRLSRRARRSNRERDLLGDLCFNEPAAFVITEAMGTAGFFGGEDACDPVQVCPKCREGAYRRETILGLYEKTLAYLEAHPEVIIELRSGMRECSDSACPEPVHAVLELKGDDGPLPVRTHEGYWTAREAALEYIRRIIAHLRTSAKDVAVVNWADWGGCPRCSP